MVKKKIIKKKVVKRKKKESATRCVACNEFFTGIVCDECLREAKRNIFKRFIDWLDDIWFRLRN